MKTCIYFLLTCFVSTGIYTVALNSRNTMIGAILAFALWGWFLWGCFTRAKKEDERRAMLRHYYNNGFRR